MKPLVVLAGPPGAGKSTVAQALSEMLKVSALDTDADVERTVGKRISDIFVDEGEAAFRQYEVSAVAAALSEHDGIVALGGGAVMDSLTQANLESYRNNGGLVVFLDVSLSFAAPRVGFNQARPLLLGNPRAQWKTLMDKRRPTYKAVSNLEILTDNRQPRDIAQEIADHLSSL